ncbi:MAG: bifunctional 2-polyprenyl-6-hydroxyphenol methylase/3-demethylubiquinol 3-O-methyltransferase UbiG [Betaproteobacteria bacterium]|nr:bifunctional 2-polyprenyl-6-hydroxyphenol methylase/3-demethylubiquinol 3-O-methyltransferase UbiG [Betaproteobacteria bacterium]
MSSIHSSPFSSANVDPAELAKFSELAHRWWDTESEFRPLHQINPLRLNWILGADLAVKSLKVAQLHALEAGTQGVQYREISAEDLALEQAGQFDVVTCMEMLEHVPDPAAVVQACAQLVKPGGWVFFSTLNRNPKSFLFAIVGAEYVLNLLPKGTHEYARMIKPSELADWVRAYGLDVMQMKGMSYNPFTKVYAMGHDTDVNYLMATQKPFRHEI